MINRFFLVSIHDGTPAFARGTWSIIRDLSPLLGRHLSLGVVPNWHGQWHLSAYPEYCRLVRESAEELLLHGYFHHRRRGSGPVTWLAEGSDEMNGLDAKDTSRIIERGQQVFTEVFGEPAEGFLAPAWRPGHVRALGVNSLGCEYVAGFSSLQSHDRQSIPLATWTWDCGRWGWLGYVGHGIGRLSHSLNRGVPMLAIHPRDLARGYWPMILRLVRELLDTAYEPTTPSALLRSFRAEAHSAGGEESRSSRQRAWPLYRENRDSSPAPPPAAPLGMTSLRSHVRSE